MESSKFIPQLKDMTVDSITENTIGTNSQCPDPRMKYVLERLVSHLHDFARETRLSTKEWEAGYKFLTAVGQICSDVRQEFIILSDILGLSMLVDSIDHPKPPHSTEGSVLGPFHTHEAQEITNGDSMSHDSNGQPLLVLCSIKDSRGKPIPGVKIDIWETDSAGRYDVQNPDREGPDGRCVMHSDEFGKFWFKAVKPVSYPIPHDGPVGKLLFKLHRHPYRPAHMHFMFEKPGYDHLITALYPCDDPYKDSDAVFGVKSSLVVDIVPLPSELATQYSTSPDSLLLEYDFVLVSDQEASDLRDQKSRKALEELGKKVKIVEGLPVPDVD